MRKQTTIRSLPYNRYHPTPFTVRFVNSTMKKEQINLMHKYGIELFEDLEVVRNKPFYDLAWLGKKYGFTREYAQQIYTNYFGEPFLDRKRSKMRRVYADKNMLKCSNDPRHILANCKSPNSNVFKGARAEKLFMDECENRNLSIEIPCDMTTDYIVNGYHVEVKGCYTAYNYRGQWKTPKVGFVLSKKQRQTADFIAFYHFYQESFFIIPVNLIPINYTRIYIVQEPSNHWNAKNRYWEYQNAWHLLNN